MGGKLKAIPSAARFSLFLPAICWDLLRGGPLTAGWSRGGAQVTPHAPRTALALRCFERESRLHASGRLEGDR